MKRIILIIATVIFVILSVHAYASITIIGGGQFLGWILCSYDPGYGFFTLELNGEIVLEKVAVSNLERIKDEGWYWYKLYDLDNVPYGQNTVRAKAWENHGVYDSDWSEPLNFNL